MVVFLHCFGTGVDTVFSEIKEDKDHVPSVADDLFLVDFRTESESMDLGDAVEQLNCLVGQE